MKIDSVIKSLGGPQAGESKPRLPAANGPAPAPSADKVQLSSLSTSLQKAEAAIANTPVIDRARVDEIRQAISEGRFKIDAGRIADGLLDSVRQMLHDAPQRP